MKNGEKKKNKERREERGEDTGGLVVAEFDNGSVVDFALPVEVKDVFSFLRIDIGLWGDEEDQGVEEDQRPLLQLSALPPNFGNFARSD
jgi:hypothetical protein